MDYLRQIEDDLRLLASTAKKRYQEVSDAVDVALFAHKSIREIYVASIMRRKNTEREIKIPQSSELLAPYLLVCNYADADTKLILSSLNGLHLLLNYDMVPTQDIQNILRVLSIQMSCAKTDVQLKILQLVTQMTNTLSARLSALGHTTETVVCNLLVLSFQLCDASDLSVSSTAEGIVRQILALVMDSADTIMKRSDSSVSNHLSDKVIALHESEEDANASVLQCAVNLVSELSLFIQGNVGEWIRLPSAQLPQTFALDLCYESLTGWPMLFERKDSPFRQLAYNTICPALRPLLKYVHDDYLVAISEVGPSNAAVLTSKIVRLVRHILVTFTSTEQLDDVEHLIQYLLHALHPNDARTYNDRLQSRSRKANEHLLSGLHRSDRSEEHSILSASGAGAFISRFSNPLGITAVGISAMKQSNKPWEALKNVYGGVGDGRQQQGAAVLMKVSSKFRQNHQAAKLSKRDENDCSLLPTHSLAVCMEALMTFYLSEASANLLSDERGVKLYGDIAHTLAIAVADFVQCALDIEVNVRALEVALVSSKMQGLTQALFSEEASTHRRDPPFSNLQRLHEYVLGSQVDPGELLLIALSLLKLAPRIALQLTLQLASFQSVLPANFSDRLSIIPKNSVARNLSPLKALSSSSNSALCSEGFLFLPEEEMRSVLPSSVFGLSERTVQDVSTIAKRISESVFESLVDVCVTVLSRVEGQSVVRSVLSMTAEMAVATGAINLSAACDTTLSVLCRYTVPVWHGHELYRSVAADGPMIDHDAGAGNDRGAPTGGGTSSRNCDLTWSHMQAFVKMLQVVHIIADAISDWDSVIDSMEQMTQYILIRKSSASRAIDDSISELELDKLLAAIQRFKEYTIFISDSALVKIMTSLVAVSMNSLSMSSCPWNAGDDAFGGASFSREANKTRWVCDPGEVSAEHVRMSEKQVQSPGGTYGAVSSIANRGSMIHVNETHGELTMLSQQSSNSSNQSSGQGGKVDSPYNLQGKPSFALQAVIEVTKLNVHRVSIVWQMVTSHLRMIATLKAPAARSLSVAATIDVIVAAFEHMQEQTHSIPSREKEHRNHYGGRGQERILIQSQKSTYGGVRIGHLLSDDAVHNHIFPTLETIFLPRSMHIELTESRSQSYKQSGPPVLSQTDLLSSLNALAAVRYSDIRSGIMLGLLDMLQEIGPTVTSGWPIIIDLISAVPASLSVQGSEDVLESENAIGNFSRGNVEDGHTDSSEGLGVNSGNNTQLENMLAVSSMPQYQWPPGALSAAFSCLKLVIDEFLDSLMSSNSLLKSLIDSLSLFCAQQRDVNVSLTSVEMLWKVTDTAITTFAQKDASFVDSVIGVMLHRLFCLSMDARPEVRHCAMNTLFSALTAHAQIIPQHKWQDVFRSVIVSLFENAAARSQQAMCTSEAANTPELKKGVRMSVHHSLDTAHKQWGETQVIALRGLGRVMKTCARNLVVEEWFSEAWIIALKICHTAMRDAILEPTVAIVALEVLFTMLRAASISEDIQEKTAKLSIESNRNDGREKPILATTSSSRQTQGVSNNSKILIGKEENIKYDVRKRALWNLCWKAVLDAAFLACSSVDLALLLCNNLSDVYSAWNQAELARIDNLQALLETVILLSRPQATRVAGNNGRTFDRASEAQLSRSVMDLIKRVQPQNYAEFSCLLSSLGQLCFAAGCVSVAPPTRFHMKQNIPLMPCPLSLRKNATEYLVEIINRSGCPVSGSNDAVETTSSRKTCVDFCSRDAALLCVDIGLKRLLEDIWSMPIRRRLETVSEIAVGQASDTPIVAQRSSQRGFFSSISMMMSPADTPIAEKDSRPGAGDPLSTSFRWIFSDDAIERKFTETSIKGADAPHLDPICLADHAELDFWVAAPWRDISLEVFEALSRTLERLFDIDSSQNALPRDPLPEWVYLAWKRSLCVLGCVMSPWRVGELLDTKLWTRTDYEALSVNNLSIRNERISGSNALLNPQLLQKSLETISRITKHKGLAKACLPSLLELLSVVTVFCMDTIAWEIGRFCDLNVKGEHSHARRPFFDLSAFFPGWMQVKELFGACYADQELPYDVRASALQCLITLAQASSSAIVFILLAWKKKTGEDRFASQRFAEIIPLELRVSCCEFLRHILALSTPLCFLFFAETKADGISTTEMHMNRWVTVCLRPTLPQQPDRNSKSDVRINGTFFNEEESCGKWHLMPLGCAALEIVQLCEDGELQKLSFEVIRATSAQNVPQALRDLMHHNADLHARNKQLAMELTDIKAAATLPF